MLASGLPSSGDRIEGGRRRPRGALAGVDVPEHSFGPEREVALVAESRLGRLRLGPGAATGSQDSDDDQRTEKHTEMNANLPLRRSAHLSSSTPTSHGCEPLLTNARRAPNSHGGRRGWAIAALLDSSHSVERRRAHRLHSLTRQPRRRARGAAAACGSRVAAGAADAFARGRAAARGVQLHQQPLLPRQGRLRGRHSRARPPIWSRRW